MTAVGNEPNSAIGIGETTSMMPSADMGNEFRPQLLPGLSGSADLPPGTALVVVKRGPSAGSRFVLDRPVISAGRHPGSDIYLDDVTASRKHAEFRRENGEFHIVDLGSLNGTYVNRKAVHSAVLVNGDEVQLGKFRLIFIAPEP